MRIKAVLDRAERVGKTSPPWVRRIEEINQQQYERNKALAEAFRNERKDT
jgi:hypothetical protein